MIFSSFRYLLYIKFSSFGKILHNFIFNLKAYPNHLRNIFANRFFKHLYFFKTFIIIDYVKTTVWYLYYKIHTGVQLDFLPGQPIGLPLNLPTLADKLKEEGYSTHMVGKWHLGFHKRAFLPTRRGFDSYFGL